MSEDVISLPHIREYAPCDIHILNRIDLKTCEHPWGSDGWEQVFKESQSQAFIAEWQYKPVGFVLYELARKKCYIHNLVVLPDYQRKKIGTRLVQRVLSSTNAKHFISWVRERNLPAQLFGKKNGFEWRCTEQQFFEDGEDCYIMMRGR